MAIGNKTGHIYLFRDVVVLSILILHYNMSCYLIHFTMQELVQLTWVLSRSFSKPCASFSMLDGPGGTSTEKLLLKTQISDDFS